MLCSRRKPLNASATLARLPDPHHKHPSRAAGSFVGRKGDISSTARHRLLLAERARSGVQPNGAFQSLHRRALSGAGAGGDL